MRIIYFCYWDDEGVFREYNLQQDIKIKKGENNVFSLSRYKELSKTFFSYQGRDGITFSAIIGENGSGKTSFARLILELAKGSERRAVLVVQDRDAICVIRNVDARFKYEDDHEDEFLAALNNKKNSRAFDVLKKGGWRFVYYSPIYTAQHDMSSFESFFVDLSTSYLLKNPTERAMPGVDSQSWHRFEREESNRVWDFLFEDTKERRRRKLVGVDTSTMPALQQFKGVKIGIREERIKNCELIFRERLRKLEEDHTPVAMSRKIPRVGLRRSGDDYSGTAGGEFCKRINAFIRQAGTSQMFLSRMIYAYVLSYCMDNGFGITQDPDDYSEQLVGLGEYIANDDPQLLMDRLSSMMGGSSAMSRDSHDALQYVREGIMVLSDWKGARAANRVQIRFDERKRSVFLNFVSGYSVLRGRGDFLTFKESPKVSSGEWAMIVMMSRLYWTLKNEGAQRYVLFLDEAETTMHPEWQRELVKKLIQFLESYFPDKSVHVILASHSPILLSDIPVGNVALLNKSRATVNNTFGCNIFDLYHIPFDLGEGAVGQFATDKIEQVLRTIRRQRDDGGKLFCKIRFTKEEREIAALTGDAFLGDYFRHYIGSSGPYA